MGIEAIEIWSICHILQGVSFAELLEEIPRLTFAQREELIRCAVALDEGGLTAEEGALLDARMEDFCQNPEAGVTIQQLREHIAEVRVSRRDNRN